MRMTEVPEHALAKIAAIIGPQSAASKALLELKRRRDNAENVYCYTDGQTFFVGPEIEDAL